MKIPFDRVLLDIKGNPLSDSDGEMTLGRVTCVAMLGPAQDDRNLTAADKVKMFKLAQLANEGNEQDVPVEHVAFLKDRIGKVCSQIVVGRVFEILEQLGPIPAKAENEKRRNTR